MQNTHTTLYSIEELQSHIEKTLYAIIPQNSTETLYKPVQYVVDGGGKRIRPLLTMLSCGLFGTSPLDAVHIGAAIEMLHNFTLVHDDIMDKSPLRRGRQTVHIHWDEATAILSGDAIIGLAYRLLLKTSSAHPRLHSIIKEFSDGLIYVCEGQALDIEYSKSTQLSIQDYLQMIELKTARLLEMAVVCGAQVAEASSNDIETMRLFARKIGIAFQLQDDLLDLTAEQAEFGKSIGQDIVEGKKTFMMLRLRDKLSPQLPVLLQQFFDEHGLPIVHLQDIMLLLHEHNILEETQAQILELTEEALGYLNILPNNDYSQILRQLTQQLLIRKK
ncbi:MAG: polyprenyl synthetase family protein [Ignavibacteria bacterium]|nr:polyprenyl synthetase family protein [Ignavibacteria bacterium]